MAVTISGSGQIVKQLVQGVITTQFNTASGSFVSTGLTASITPTNSANKILVVVASGLFTSGTAVQGFMTIYRNATDLSASSSTSGFIQAYSSAGAIWGNCSFTLLDSPATTSSTSYTIYVRTAGAGTTTFGQDTAGAPRATITLMEIAYA
jgi:hypothetical protein